MSTTFKVSDLTLFDVGDDLRINLFKEGENNRSQVAIDPLSLPNGTIIWVGKKRLQDVLNGVVREVGMHMELNQVEGWALVSLIQADLEGWGPTWACVWRLSSIVDFI